MAADPADEWHLTEPAEAASPYAVLKSWEKLRLVYNAVLVPWVLLNVAAARPAGWDDPVFWAGVATAGLGANVCFCAGPVAEAYLAWLGADAAAARAWLFALGTGFTALGAAAAIWSN
ncbi:MAG: hypothetical protein C0501_15770 [Isosphaera sp.]|nr:hypothetical protein [Isosphaera sp.]